MVNLLGWGVILYLTRGYYHPTFIYFLIPLLILAWAGLKFFSFSFSITTQRFYYLLISLFCFLNGYHLLVIYPKNRFILESIRLVFFVLSIVFLALAMPSVKKEKISNLVTKVTFGILVCCLFSIPFISPEPYIDVWYHTELALYRLFAFGDNPYSYQDYPQLYREYHSTFVYPPMCLYVLAPFRLMSIDIRLGMATLLSASALFFYLSAHKSISSTQRLLMPLAFLSFPATYFVLEQSWMDPISVFFLSLALLFKSKNKTKGFELALGFFIASKHYNILCLPVLMFWISNDWKDRIFASVRIGLIALATFLPFLIWNAPALLERMLPGAPHRSNVFYGLNSWLGLSGIEIPNSIALIWILLSSFIIIGFWRKKSPDPILVFGMLSAVIVTFFTLYSNSAINYLWFSLIGFWFTCHYQTTKV